MSRKTFFRTWSEWRQAGKELFGTEDAREWAWKCPSCGRKQSIREFKAYEALGANVMTAARQCIGRFGKAPDGFGGCSRASDHGELGDIIVMSEEKIIYLFDFWRDQDTDLSSLFKECIKSKKSNTRRRLIRS